MKNNQGYGWQILFTSSNRQGKKPPHRLPITFVSCLLLSLHTLPNPTEAFLCSPNHPFKNDPCHRCPTTKTSIFSKQPPPPVPLSDEKNDSVDDNSRRKLLGTAAALSSTLLGLPDPAFSSSKVQLTTSSENFPGKSFSPDRTEASSSPLFSQSVCEDPEEKRIKIFERVAPSVVFIDTFAEQKDAFSTNVMEVPLGTGSGFVWDEKGHIVTNYHVVRNVKTANVAILTRVFPDDGTTSVTSKNTEQTKQKQFSSVQNRKEPKAQSLSSYSTQMRPLSKEQPGNKNSITYIRNVYKARVVGIDPGKDVAVLKVDAPVYDLHPIQLGTSSGLRVGQQALAIGNPFGLDHSLTSGVISGLGREVKSPIGRPISNVIQTDAAINPGNSGGTLLDSSGRLIGMNTAIYSPSGASAGIGFAVPIDSVKYIVDTLIRDGKIVRPVIGISYLESKQAQYLGIRKGVLVLDVPVSSPAFKAGMRGTRRTESGLIEIGDIIIKVEDEDIDTESDLFQALEAFKPGDFVNIVVNRVEADNGVGKGSKVGVELKMKEVKMTTQLKAMSETPAAMSF